MKVKAKEERREKRGKKIVCLTVRCPFCHAENRIYLYGKSADRGKDYFCPHWAGGEYVFYGKFEKGGVK